MKKKLVSILLAAVMAVSLVGCGAQGTNQAPVQSDTAETDSASASDEAAQSRPNRLIYGSTTEVSGDMGNAWWTNNATDKMIRELINDYDVVTYDRDGSLLVNSAVVDGETNARWRCCSGTY